MFFVPLPFDVAAHTSPWVSDRYVVTYFDTTLQDKVLASPAERIHRYISVARSRSRTRVSHVNSSSRVRIHLTETAFTLPLSRFELKNVKVNNPVLTVNLLLLFIN